MASSAPRTLSNDGVIEAAQAALGDLVVDTKDHVGEITLTVRREGVAEVCRLLRDTPGLEYQQLMEIAGVDYPDRPERFEVNYHLLSLTRNHRIRVKVQTDEDVPVPSVIEVYPCADWFEREAFDMYGMTFADHPDLRRLLTDYGFQGFPLRKDFPLTGYVEVRWDDELKRVVYEPIKLPQQFRPWDFLSPWEVAEYVLPGDEKAQAPKPGGPA